MRTSEILRKIREANPELMELSFGCEVIVYGEVYIIDSNWGIYSREENDKSGYYRVIANEMNNWTRIDEDNFEIIGHPVHLEHLLVAMRKGRSVGIEVGDDLFFTDWVKEEDYRYDLTKSVKANLESNEALREFISALLTS